MAAKGIRSLTPRDGGGFNAVTDTDAQTARHKLSSYTVTREASSVLQPTILVVVACLRLPLDFRDTLTAPATEPAKRLRK
jgi:hypothetical protein